MVVGGVWNVVLLAVCCLFGCLPRRKTTQVLEVLCTVPGIIPSSCL